MTDDRNKEIKASAENNVPIVAQAVVAAASTVVLGVVGTVAGGMIGGAIERETRSISNNDTPTTTQLAAGEKTLESPSGVHTWSAKESKELDAKAIAEETRRRAAKEDEEDTHTFNAIKTGATVGGIGGASMLPLMFAGLCASAANKKRKQFMEELKKDRERELNERGIDR